jgi:hypothetical protein
MQRCPCSVKHTGVTWGISGDVCHILLCSSTGTLDTFVSRIARANHGVECNLPPTMRMPLMCGKSFFFGEEQIGPTLCHVIAFSCCILTK